METIERKIMKQKTFRIPESLNEKLAYLADATGYSENEIITMALEEKIEENKFYLAIFYLEQELIDALSRNSIDFIRESWNGGKPKIPSKIEKVYYNDTGHFYPYYFSLEYIEDNEITTHINYFDRDEKLLGSDVIRQKDFFKGDTANLKKGANTYYRKLLKNLVGLTAFKEYMSDYNDTHDPSEYFFWENKSDADEDIRKVWGD